MDINNIVHGTDLDRELQIWQKEQKHKASQIGASQNEKKK